MNNKAYIQFSKRIVVAVTICVTVICAASIVLMYLGQSLDNITEIVKTYISYAMVVFAAYSANSVSQKLVMQKFKAGQKEAQERQAQG